MRRVTRDLDLEDLRLDVMSSDVSLGLGPRSLGLGLSRPQRSADLAINSRPTPGARHADPSKGSPVRLLPNRSYSESERGQALVLIVVTLTVLLGAAALTIDVGYAYFAHRSLQADADAAALAGAGGLPNTTTATDPREAVQRRHGREEHQGRTSRSSTRTCELKCLGTPGCTTMNAVHVTQHATVKSFFARVIGVKQFEVNAEATACSPGLGQATLVDEGTSNCPLPPGPCVLGYPFTSSNPRTKIVFNESEVLRSFAPELSRGPGDTIKVWYNDEHALTLGVRQVGIKLAKNGPTTTTDYPITALAAVPSGTTNPAVGTTAMTGDQAGLDPLDRPEFPAIFVTDLTNDPNSRSATGSSAARRSRRTPSTARGRARSS